MSKLNLSKEFTDINSYIRIAQKTGSPIFKPNERLTVSDKDNINPNIWVIRTPNRTAGKFDDIEVLFYYSLELKRWVFQFYSATADPSDIALEEMHNPLGTAIIAFGYHKSAWQLGYHKGREDHKALVQTKPILVYRDRNKDDKADLPDLSKCVKKTVSIAGKSTVIAMPSTNLYDITLREEATPGERIIQYFDEFNKCLCQMQLGRFGINNHRASAWKELQEVGLYSEGCIVQNNPNNYNDVFIPTIETSTKYYGKDVSITVVPESEFYEK